MKEFQEWCVESATNSMELFLKTFAFVPDDRLTWTPVSSAKSALRIAAHTAVYAGNFAKMIREQRLPMGDEIPDFLKRTETAEMALVKRHDIERIYRENTEEVVLAIRAVTPETLALTLDTSLGWAVPMTTLLALPGRHAATHAGQIDYLQTCWGDFDVHF